MVKREDIFINLINKVRGLGELEKQAKAINSVNTQGAQLDKTVGALGQTTAGMSDKDTKLANSRQFLAEQSDRLGKNTAEVSRAMGDQGAVFDKVGEVVDKAGRPFEDINQMMDDGIRRTQPFQMGFLGVMFAGMALDRAMSSLVKTSLEWVGITELMSLTMGILFLPIAELFLNALLPIAMWFMDLPDWAKMAIGGLVAFFLVVGKVAFIVGQFGLAIASLNMFKFGQTILNMFGIGKAADTATGKVSKLKSKLGKTVGVAVGLSIAWAGFEFIKAGIDEGSLIKEVTGVLAMGVGFATVGFMFGGPVGAALGFTLGVTVGLIVSWFLKDQNIDSFGLDPSAGIGEVNQGTGILNLRKVPKTKIDLTGGLDDSVFGGSPRPSFQLPEGFLQSREINMTIIQNISGSTQSEIKRQIDAANRTIVNDFRRQTR